MAGHHESEEGVFQQELHYYQGDHHDWDVGHVGVEGDF